MKSPLLSMDRRRQRTNAFVAEILHIVSRHLSDEDYRRDALHELSVELFEKAYEAGIEIITDADRAAAGLPPRGPEGWTIEELAILEEKRLEAMRRPIFMLDGERKRREKAG